MTADGSDKIQGVDDELIATVAGLTPAVPNIRVAEADRFAQAVRTLVERRAQNDWPNENPQEDLAVFVLVDRPRQVGRAHDGRSFRGSDGSN